MLRMLNKIHLLFLIIWRVPHFFVLKVIQYSMFRQLVRDI